MRLLVHRLFPVSLSLLALLVAARDANKAPPPEEANFASILQTYNLVGDFAQKPGERELGGELFWRYPLPLPRVEFPILYDFGESREEMPASEGDDRASQHLNRGRILYLEGHYDEALKVWLTARARFGKEYPLHRRTDYFISLAFLKIAEAALKKAKGDLKDPEVRLAHSNSATFLAWAYLNKRDIADPLLTLTTPKGLYNLAAIYYTYDRYQGAHAAAEEGLNTLRASGRKELRGQFHRLMAETWIRDHNYLRAAQVLDTMIRQEAQPHLAALAFARMGDIYFDLNNYELAEDAYGISQRIDHEVNQVAPLSAILRGEALFWLGDFSAAQKLLQFGLDSTNYKTATAPLAEPYRAWAALRIADAYLARYRAAKKDSTPEARVLAKDLLRRSALAYFQVGHSFPQSEAAKIAAIRRACLELPTYEGKNVGHSRQTLASARDDNLPLQAIELAWSCEILSYGQREKDVAFIGKVKEFYGKFPASRFLHQYVPYVHDIRAQHLGEYFAAGEPDKAMAYYEHFRTVLFKELRLEDKQALFTAYVDSFATPKAAPFWQDYAVKAKEDPLAALRLAVFFSEMAAAAQKAPAQGPKANDAAFWDKANARLAADPIFHPLRLTYAPSHLAYFQRLLATAGGGLHLGWLNDFAAAASAENPVQMCALSYPLLSQAAAAVTTPAAAAKLWQQLATTTTRWLPGLFASDQNCGEGLLHLEVALSQRLAAPHTYAHLWLERLEWPNKAVTIPLIWEAAETLAHAQDLAAAEKLWLFLAKQDATLYPEAAYAKQRLDRSRTEVEGLWQ